MMQNLQTLSNTQAQLAERFQRIRQFTDTLVEPLSPEDCSVQSMPDVSPTRWHLAHTTWFFETFVLKETPHYQVVDPSYEFLFNSYYNTVGAQFPRAQRGMLSRPALREILDYRQAVNTRLLTRLEAGDISPQLADVIELGLQHEQQHQELILTDIKHVLAQNPLYPQYRAANWELGHAAAGEFNNNEWLPFDEGLYEVGHTGGDFAYDNESPRHRVFLHDFELYSQLVTNGDYLQFVELGGYADPNYWLSLGWNAVNSRRWQSPLYWIQHNGDWYEFTLAGLKPLDLSRPVCHLSYFEADAYARSQNARLPTEMEWEIAAADVSRAGNFADILVQHDLPLHPHNTVVDSLDIRDQLQPDTVVDSITPGTCDVLRRNGCAASLANGPQSPSQMFGDVWEWTASSYAPYPGYQPAPGALGEYNGKFMCQQYVLRGGSVATSSDHIRHTYRNFFPPESRWQFAGLRLAR